LSITTAWNESSDFLKRHFGALFTIALALIALPSVVAQALGPGAGSGTAGQPPEPGLWMLLVPVVLVLNLAGSLAISSLALGRKNVVGEAIAHGLRRAPALLGAILILIAAASLLLIPLTLISGVTPEMLAQPNPAKAGRYLLTMILFGAIALSFAARLLLVTPIAAAEAVGPIAIIRRSWSLTSGHFAKLLGFLGLMIILAVVVTAVVTLLFGLLAVAVAGPPEPRSIVALLLLLVGGIVNAAFVVVTTTLVARIYLQLAGPAGAGGSASTTGT
jgi:hypothetical protein